eukprot:4851824-Amphidinium_carterae.1
MVTCCCRRRRCQLIPKVLCLMLLQCTLPLYWWRCKQKESQPHVIKHSTEFDYRIECILWQTYVLAHAKTIVCRQPLRPASVPTPWSFDGNGIGVGTNAMSEIGDHDPRTPVLHTVLKAH